MIAERISPVLGREYVTCDSSEPKSIAELKQHRINALSAKKGKDSVLHGIQWLQQHRIVIHRGCQHVINEFQMYQWEKDRDGNALNKPVDRDNHGIDATRYAYESEMRNRIISGVRVII